MNFLLQSSADHSVFGVPSKKKTNDSAFMAELAFNVKDAISVPDSTECSFANGRRK